MSAEESSADLSRQSILWRRSIAWLLFLGPFFFLSYGAANQFAASRGITNSLVFDWERQIPLVPWTILPYWSIDLLYGFSFLCCRGKQQVDRHALRLLTAQIISVVCFVFFPLCFSFERPESTGMAGMLFAALTSFDKPYNQAPSLHIGLLVLIWFQFARLRTHPAIKALIHGWALLIAVSVLTTWQHHFIDVPTGAAVGFLCLWLWPEEGTSPLRAALTTCPRRRMLAGRYLVGAAVLLVVAIIGGGGLLWLAWPALSLSVVAVNYAWAGATGFQKHGGRHSLAVRVLLGPYLVGAWVNSRLWTRHHPAPDPITEDVSLGRLPSSAEFCKAGCDGLLDLAVELPSPSGVAHLAHLHWLDLTPPSAGQLLAAARHIEDLRKRGKVLVACALGFSRSAAAVAAWLHWSGQSKNMAEAVDVVRGRRPQIVMTSEWAALFNEFEAMCREQADAARPS